MLTFKYLVCKVLQRQIQQRKGLENLTNQNGDMEWPGIKWRSLSFLTFPKRWSNWEEHQSCLRFKRDSFPCRVALNFHCSAERLFCPELLEKEKLGLLWSGKKMRTLLKFSWGWMDEWTKLSSRGQDKPLLIEELPTEHSLTSAGAGPRTCLVGSYS